MKTHKLVIPAIAAAMLFTAASVAAQMSVTATASPGTGTAPAGTQVNLGTVTLTGSGGATVTSIPLTFTSSGGAALSHLSNCQLYNTSGTSLTTGGNVVTSIGSGASVFQFNAPISVSSSPTTLTVRCDVGSSIPSTGMFSYTVGTPTLGTGTTTQPTLPALSVNLDVAPSVPRGSNDVALANISLGAGTSSSVRISSIPLDVVAGANASVTNLSDCRIRDASNVGGSLSNSVNVLSSGATVFTLTNPIIIPAGGSEMLSFTCDVTSSTPIGGTFTISIVPGNVGATNPTTGAAITGVPATGIGPNGLPAATSGTVIVTGTVPGGGGGTGTTTPGIPNTGLGGNVAMTLGILLLAGLLALGGAALMRRA
jgi:hypothetical protein